MWIIRPRTPLPTETLHVLLPNAVLAAALPGQLPVEAVLLLTLATALVALAALGPAEAPPSYEVTTAAIFALHGHV